MAGIGDAAHEYFRFLIKTKESYWARIVRVVLGLVKGYGKEEVNLSLRRALYYKVTDITTVKNILKKRLYLLKEEPKLLGISVEDKQIQCQETGLFRDLTYYTQNGDNAV